MAVTEMELAEALNRASALMSTEGQRKINSQAKQKQGSFDLEGNYIGSYSNNYQTHTPITPNKNSKLPKVIQESILNHPIDDTMNEFSSTGGSGSGSVLDMLGYMPKQQEVIKETQQPIYQQPQYAPSIDYNYIRTIINECIKANLQQIKEEILKESSLKAIRLGAENKIQLIDNKNNLYESKLEFKKSLTKK